MAKDERVERLRAIPLFMACSEKQLQFISRSVEDLDFKAGKVLCQQGKSGGEFFIVLSGEAQVERDGKVVDTIKAGDHFGEIALLDFKAGKVLCQQGKSGGEFFIVLSGEAEVERDGKVVDMIKTGDHFGEIALLDDGPRTATVTAKTDLRCLVLSPRQFQDVLHQDAEIAVHMLRDVTKRLRAATRTLPAD